MDYSKGDKYVCVHNYYSRHDGFQFFEAGKAYLVHGYNDDNGC
jgi:hypothetical protein